VKRRFAHWTAKALDAFAPSATPEDLRRIFLVWILTTGALWVLAYGAASVFLENRVTTWHYTHLRALDVWARWDSALYTDIARWGYQRREGRADNTPWFPLYPYLIRYLMPHPRYHYPMGQAISLVCFLLLLCVLFDVVAKAHGTPVAHRAVLYMSIFPSALFFRAVYSESLFTLLVLLTYRAFIRERYLPCGIYGALAAMTRLPGVMLLPAFGATVLWEAAMKKRPFRPAMFWLGLIPIGLLAVMAIQWREVGDPLAFLHSASRPDLNRSLSLPGASVVGDLQRMAAGWNFPLGNIEFNLILDDVVAVAAMVGAVYFFRRYGFLPGCLSLCLLLPAVMSGRTIGMIRYVLPIFFYVVFLAEIGDRRPGFHNAWLIVSSLLLAFYTICFACWYWTA